MDSVDNREDFIYIYRLRVQKPCEPSFSTLSISALLEGSIESFV